MTNKTDTESRVVYYHSLAVIEMGKRKIPMTPKNYTLWYEYVTENDSSIMEQIKKLDASYSEYTPELNAKLYEQFFKGSENEDSTEDVKQFIYQMVDGIVKGLEAGGVGLQEFSTSLRGTLDKIGMVTDNNSLKAVVVGLSVEVNKQIERNLKLEETLRNTSKEVSELKNKIAKVNKDVLRDSLTKVGNKRCFDKRLSVELTRFKEQELPLSLIVLDVDHFKKFNDKYGHLVGDKVLKYVSTLTSKAVRGADKIHRVGGEEFAIILPNTTYYGALTVAEHVREEISKKRLMNGDIRLERITVSLGVATADFDDTESSIFERADKCLYRAKNQGRNQVIGEDTICEDLD